LALDIVTFGECALMLVLVLGSPTDRTSSKHVLFPENPDFAVLGTVGWTPLPTIRPVSTPAALYTHARDMYTNTVLPCNAKFQFRVVEVMRDSGFAHV
jgi:hypothetical protein